MSYIPVAHKTKVRQYIIDQIAPENICLQSEDLSTTWTNFQSTDTQAQGTAPDGTNTANKVIADNGGGSGTVEIGQSVTLATSTVYTYSTYLKADTLSFGMLRVRNLGALTISAFFDLTNGVVGITTGADNTSEFIEDVGNGWFRCGIVFLSDAVDTSASLNLDLADADSDQQVARDGVSSNLWWGAQLEEGSAPTRYSPTTTVPTKIYPNGNINTLYKRALGTNLSLTDAQINAKSIDDLWKQYVTDTLGYTFTGLHLNNYNETEDSFIYPDDALTLFYRFAQDKSLVATYGLGPTLGITRTTTATYYDSNGILTTAASGEARFDHDPATLQSLGLLVEEARINICLQSEDWDTTPWIDASDGLTTADQAVAPDGLTTADKLHDDSSSGTGTVRTVQSLTIATSTTHVISMYAKADGLDWFRILVVGLGSLSISAFYDLTNGVVGATTGSGNTSEFIEDVGNGWFRCGIVFESDAADSSGQIDLRVAVDNNDNIVDLDGTSSIFLWGAQVEAGAFPTSYIPTTTISVTRNADVVSTTDVSWYNSLGGTFYAKVPDDRRDFTSIIFQLDDGTDTNRHVMFTSAAELGSYIITATTAQVNLVGEDMTNLSGHLASTAVLNDVEFFVNGVRTGVGDQGATMPVGISRLTIAGRQASSEALSGHVQELRYYNVRKDNQFLEDLSNGLI